MELSRCHQNLWHHNVWCKKFKVASPPSISLCVNWIMKRCLTAKVAILESFSFPFNAGMLDPNGTCNSLKLRKETRLEIAKLVAIRLSFREVMICCFYIDSRRFVLNHNHKRPTSRGRNSIETIAAAVVENLWHILVDDNAFWTPKSKIIFEI